MHGNFTKNVRKIRPAPENNNALEVANQIMEEGIAKYSHPNFIGKINLHMALPNDEYFNWQWHFHNTGQQINDGRTCVYDADIDAVQAWNITTGSEDVIVAVLDDGVVDDHPDLPLNRQLRLPGSNFGTRDPFDGTPTDDPYPDAIWRHHHGTACAGIISASHNSIGVAGIAPDCMLMPIRIFDIITGFNQLAEAIHFAADNGADVLSNSWGMESTDPNFFPDIVDAIEDVLPNGRDGRGCVVAFAASNTANHLEGDPGEVQFPANVEGVITVGASNRGDNVSNYSPISNLIDIVAPSQHAYPSQDPNEDLEIWTTDIPGSYGYQCPGNYCDENSDPLPSWGNDWASYTGRFGGTSAACPQVAGTAALILSRNPRLSQSEVVDVLIKTADRIGGYNYVEGRCNEVGYGRLNAYKAVKNAFPDITPILHLLLED